MKNYPNMPEKLKKERNYNNLAVCQRRAIQPVMTKFLSYFKKIKNIEKQGWNNNEYMSAAVKEYEKKYKSKLRLS